jgi:dTDP-glucose 4,6-dehydratase
MRIIVTGAAGFIGSHLCRHLLALGEHDVHGVDSLTYAANPITVTELQSLTGFTLHQQDLADFSALGSLFAAIKPDAVMHLAAETHVDRSIEATAPFIKTNVMGTCHLLQAALDYWRHAPPETTEIFRLLHVSTDEVYGSLEATGHFTPHSAAAPNSPYAASKAAAEAFVRAFGQTYDLPVLTVNACNVYGPYQFPEKLIPTMILKAIHGEILPLYGTGDNIREWLYVKDMVAGLMAVLTRGTLGKKYHLSAKNEISNLRLVQKLCAELDRMEPDSAHCPHSNFIQFVADRPAHDFRYALDCTATESALGWKAQVTLDEGLSTTIAWYLSHPDWWQKARIMYDGRRLGLIN